MKTKTYYIKPNIEIIELEVEENTCVVATSDGATVDVSENPTEGIGRARRRNFWGREEE